MAELEYTVVENREVLFLDVILWGNIEFNPHGFPSNYPGQCIEVYDVNTPITPGSQRMTLQELENLKASLSEEFQAWCDDQAANASPPNPTIRDELALLKAEFAAFKGETP